jgi:general L-amino acid transport system permease protein
VGAVGFAGAVTTVLLLTARSNLADRGISTDFGFLTQSTQFEIGESSFSPSDPIWRAVLEGAKNTGLSMAIGIPLTTLLGVLIGVSRLSKNFLVRKAAAFYVETLRNIPPLLVILFTNTVILTLPIIQEGSTPFNLFVISNRRFAMPSIVNGDNAGLFWIVVLGGLAAAVVVWRWQRHRPATPSSHLGPGSVSVHLDRRLPGPRRSDRPVTPGALPGGPPHRRRHHHAGRIRHRDPGAHPLHRQPRG